MSRLSFLASYLTCGLLHELCHLIVARTLFEDSSPVEPFIGAGVGTLNDWIVFVGRALLGRYCIVGVGDGDEGAISIIRHSGWIFSLLLAVFVHGACVTYWRGEGHDKSDAGLRRPAVILAAYVTALEAIATDLLGFAPELGREVREDQRVSVANALTDLSLPRQVSRGSVVMFCGNFGILLINSSWINVDGGKRALDVLEKMIEVTMMRGKQCNLQAQARPYSSCSLTYDLNHCRGSVRGSCDLRARITVGNERPDSSDPSCSLPCRQWKARCTFERRSPSLREGQLQSIREEEPARLGRAILQP